MASAATMPYPTASHRQQPSRAGSSRSRHSDYDRFYGHREVSELSESVITTLFACPLDSTSTSVTPATATSQRGATPRLAEFIAYALHRTRLPEEITYQALFLLRRLKSRFPAARGSSGHRLFISALMLASKSSCDDTYSNKSWTVVSQGLFSLREVNQMERELFGYLGFKVNVEMEELSLFRSMLLTGDILAVLDCVSPQQSPNPATEETSSPSQSSAAVDRGCETPTAAQPQPASAPSDSTAAVNRRQPSIRRSDRVSVPSYNPDVHSSAAAMASAVAAAQNLAYVQQHPYQVPVYPRNDVSPSSASVASSRGSISSSSGYSMTPSPSSLSHSEASSSRTTPDTPPSELCGSPWTSVEGKTSIYNGEPAGTYEDINRYYVHPQDRCDFVLPSNQAHVYATQMADSTRPRHPYHY